MTTTMQPDQGRRLHSGLVLAGLVAASFVVAALGGLATASNVDGWYAGGDKPAWTPPNGVFGPVWTILYVLMALSAWLVWVHGGGFADQRRAFTLYAVQLGLNLLWTPVFFAAEQIELALVVIVALDVVLAATLVTFWRIHRPAGWLLVPYLAWSLFATTLNAGFIATL
jgi:tryptophan-rich sensory protein